MQEASTNELVIFDFPKEVVRSVVDSLYDLRTVLTEIDKYLEQMLALAHKYDVTLFLELSEMVLVSVLCVQNAVDLLRLADLYERTDLKAAAMKFIVRNAPALLSKDDIVAFIGVDLWNELLVYIADHFVSE